MSKFELYYPLDEVIITQPFGVNGDWYQKNGINIIGHNGIDFRTQHGTPIRACHDGVIFYSIDDKEGCGAVIRSTEKFDYNSGSVFFKTVYWHFCNPQKEPAYKYPFVSGDKVKTGDIIGFADNTGLSTGDHLHFALKPQLTGENDWIWFNLEQNNGYAGAIDPTPFWNKYYAKNATWIVKNLETQISVYAKIIEIIEILKKRFAQKK